MKLDVVDLDNGVAKAVLSGRLDIDGAAAIGLPFSALAGSKNKVIVDLSDVSFLASLGMRTLVSGAKTVSRRGGGMVVLNPQPNVAKVLKASGVDTIIPIVDDMAAAFAKLNA